MKQEGKVTKLYLNTESINVKINTFNAKVLYLEC